MKKVFVLFLCLMLFGCSEKPTKVDKYQDVSEENMAIVEMFENDLDVDDIKRKYVVEKNAFTSKEENEDYELHTLIYRIGNEMDEYDTMQFVILLEKDKDSILNEENIIDIEWSDNFDIANSSCITFYDDIGILSGNSKLISSVDKKGLKYQINTKANGKDIEDVIVVVDVKKKNETGTGNLVASYKKNEKDSNLIVTSAYFEY